MSDKKDKKYRRIGWIWSVTIQLMMLLLFYFLVAWKEPFPPIPTYGIEVSFGTVEESAPSESIENTQESQQTENSLEEETTSSSQEELQDEVVVEPETETEPIVEQPEPSETIEEVPEEISDVPSPDLVEEVEPESVVVESEPVADEVEEPSKEVETPVEEVSEPESQEEEVKEETESSTEDNSTDSSDEDANADNNTNSNADTEGDGKVGIEEGTIDDRAIMGKAGTPDGASLQLTGWSWDSKPKPQDSSSESGVIKYEISVDADGYIQNVSVVTSTVSPVVERYYRQSVERLTFSRTSNNTSASISKGYITFIIKSK